MVVRSFSARGWGLRGSVPPRETKRISWQAPWMNRPYLPPGRFSTAPSHRLVATIHGRRRGLIAPTYHFRLYFMLPTSCFLLRMPVATTTVAWNLPAWRPCNDTLLKSKRCIVYYKEVFNIYRYCIFTEILDCKHIQYLTQINYGSVR